MHQRKTERIYINKQKNINMKRLITTIKKSLLIMALMFTTIPAVANVVTATDAATMRTALIRITTVNYNDKEHDIKHRAPASYSSTAEATFDGDSSILELTFCQPASEVSISLHKDGMPVSNDTYGDVEAGETFAFDLSEQGTGQYEIIVTTYEEELHCSIVIE